MKALFVMIAAMFLVACEEKPVERVARKVVETLDCTEGTGGWGGVMGRCRVVYEDGSRGTVIRPVSPGDTVVCRATNLTSEYSCFVK